MRHTGRHPRKQGMLPGRSTGRRRGQQLLTTHGSSRFPGPGECEWQVPLQSRLPEPPQASPPRLDPLQARWRWAQGLLQAHRHGSVTAPGLPHPPIPLPRSFPKEVLLCVSHQIFLGLFITEVALP